MLGAAVDKSLKFFPSGYFHVLTDSHAKQFVPRHLGGLNIEP